MFRNLDAELARKGIRRGDLAKSMNLSPSTLSLKLNGKSYFTLNEAVKIKQLIGADLLIEELFDVSGSTNATTD